MTAVALDAAAVDTVAFDPVELVGRHAAHNSDADQVSRASTTSRVAQRR